jgi:hypothetical protein
MEAEGLDFAATNGGASVEGQWEQEVYADPARPDKTSVPIEDAWRKLEELTGQLKHEERVVKPGKAPEVEIGGGYEKAAEEPQRPEAADGPGLHRLGATGEEWNQPEEEAVQRHSGDYRDWEREAEGDAWQGGADWAAEGNNASAADDSWSNGEQDSWSDPAEADLLVDDQEASDGQEAETFYQSDSLDMEEADAEDGDGYFHSLEYKLLKAEVQYCVEEEMAVQAADFLIRRTGLLYFDRERAEEIAIDVIEIMAELLDWSEREVTDQKLQLAKEWELATTAFKWEQD